MMQAFAALAMLFAADDASLRAGDHTRTLDQGGLERSYLVHVPPQYDPATPMPVVLAFHGGGANAGTMVTFGGLNEKADQAGFIVVYPEGTGRLERMRTFNAGNCCGHAASQQIDDVAFTRQILDDLEDIANVDRRRIFATGMSNGAMMAYRLASELSDRIAAIAPVGGPMGTKDCHPGRAVILAIRKPRGRRCRATPVGVHPRSDRVLHGVKLRARDAAATAALERRKLVGIAMKVHDGDGPARMAVLRAHRPADGRDRGNPIR